MHTCTWKMSSIWLNVQKLWNKNWAVCCQKKQEGHKVQIQHVNVIDEDNSVVYLREPKTNETARIFILNDGNAWYQELIINGGKINLKLDTGAQVNVMPEKE